MSQDASSSLTNVIVVSPWQVDSCVNNLRRFCFRDLGTALSFPDASALCNVRAFWLADSCFFWSWLTSNWLFPSKPALATLLLGGTLKRNNGQFRLGSNSNYPCPPSISDIISHLTGRRIYKCLSPPRGQWSSKYFPHPHSCYNWSTLLNIKPSQHYTTIFCESFKAIALLLLPLLLPTPSHKNISAYETTTLLLLLPYARRRPNKPEFDRQHYFNTAAAADLNLVNNETALILWLQWSTSALSIEESRLQQRSFQSLRPSPDPSLQNFLAPALPITWVEVDDQAEEIAPRRSFLQPLQAHYDPLLHLSHCLCNQSNPSVLVHLGKAPILHFATCTCAPTST